MRQNARARDGLIEARVSDTTGPSSGAEAFTGKLKPDQDPRLE
jgi:hypothetical protein